MDKENNPQNSDVNSEDISKNDEQEQFVEVQLDNLIEEKEESLEKSDDELWDPSSELDDVSLLDEFAEELEELEKSEKEKKDKYSDDLSEILNLDEALRAEEKKTEEEEATPPVVAEERESHLLRFLPIAVSAISLAFLATGVYVFFTLFEGAKSTIKPPAGETPKTKVDEPIKKEPKDKEPKDAPKVEDKTSQQIQLPHFESLALSSFIIPAVQNGQLVFLNLQITLLVLDESTKKQLLQRETRIRDAIYRELKGVDVSKGVSENTLIMLRKPIIDRINSEIAPLKVEDIRISGYILK